MVALAAVLWTVVVSQSVPSSSTAAQPARTGLIVGRVVDGTTGRPVSGAIVTLEGGGIAGGPLGGPRALSSGTGQFVFRKLPKGAYQLRASRAGYAPGSYGQRRPDGISASLQLDDGQRVGDAVIAIWRHATISGTVVDEAGEPLVNVQLRAFRRRFVGGRPRVVPAGAAATDDRGLYRFASLVPGDYLVAFVWREASVPSATAEWMMNNPGGLNDPKNADLMRERAIVGAAFASPGTAGAMQVGSLVRDIPFASAVPPPSSDNGPLFIYATQFYPGVPSAARARVITLASGESRDGIDFALRPEKTARVSGTLVGPNGPVANTAVRLLSATDEALTDLEASATLTGAGGEFTLLGVPAGQYVLKVQRVPRPTQDESATVTTQIQVGSSMLMTSSSSGGPDTGPPPVPDDPTLVADLPIAVADRDVNDLLVPLQRAARLTGRVEFDGNATRPDGAALKRISVSLQPVDGSRPLTPFLFPTPGHADETGAFKTYGVPAGRYTLSVSAPQGWTFRSATAGDRDLAAPFDLRGSDINDVVVTFTDRPTKVSGSVHAANGNADAGALVVVFPEDSGWSSAAWNPRRVRVARTDRNGAYTFSGLPAGDYYVAAIHEETTPEWQDPQVLETLSRLAAQVHLGEGDTRTQELKSSGGGL